MSQDLLSAASHCDKQRGRGDPRCNALYSAGAGAQSAAVSLYNCTLPFVQRARSSWTNYLDSLSTFERANGEQLPMLPDQPAC